MIRSLISFLRQGPRKLYVDNIKLPLIKFVYTTVELYRIRANNGINNVKDLLLRGTVVAFTTSLLVWLSIFMYMAFYYAYVPTVSHEKPVHLQFKACEDVKGICSFPSAHIQLTKRQQVLMMGQSYKVTLNLEMPESPVNKQLGMFMVCAHFRTNTGRILAHSCRSTMLHYRSFLMELMHTIVYSPLLLFGNLEQKQLISVELFTDYQEDDVEDAVTDVFVEVQTKHIELYSAKFLINAHFSGLRYILFNWPILSAAIGITVNLFCIALVCLISWYQLIHSEEYRSYEQSMKALQRYDTNFDDESSSSSVEDASFLDEDRQQGLRRRIMEENEEVEEVVGADDSP